MKTPIFKRETLISSISAALFTIAAILYQGSTTGQVIMIAVAGFFILGAIYFGKKWYDQCKESDHTSPMP